MVLKIHDDYCFSMMPKLEWKRPTIFHEPLFDFSICQDQQSLDIIYKSAEEPLRSTHINEISEIIAKEPYIIKDLLNTEFIDQLLELNPQIVIILLKLSPISHSLIIGGLHKHCIDLPVMEVIKELSTDKITTSDELYLIIEHMASKCETLSDKDVQDRSIRMVCLFVKSLLERNVVRFNIVAIILESFCLKFSRLKDAVEFYKYLKYHSK